MDRRIIASNVANELGKAAESEVFEKWSREEKWKNSQAKFKQVNHEVFGIAISKIKANTHRFVVRFFTAGCLQEAEKISTTRKKTIDVLCVGGRERTPRISSDVENVIAKRSFKKMLEMNHIGAPPKIGQTFMLNLKAWREEKPIERDGFERSVQETCAE